MTSADILEHSTLSSWLAAAVAEHLAAHPKLSQRRIAAEMGVQPGMFHNAVTGVRPLPTRFVDAVGNYFQLDPGERDVLAALAELDHARGPAACARAQAAVAGLQRMLRARRLGRRDREYVTHWYTVAIREMSAMPGFQADPEWVAARLRPPISEAQAAEALLVLASCDAEIQDPSVELSTLHDPPEQIAQDWTVQVLRVALSAANLPRDARHFESYTAAVPASTLPKLKRMLAEFTREVIAACSAEDEPKDRLIQFSAQLFPLVDTHLSLVNER